MNGEQAYLNEVSRRLTGMDPKVKSDIVMELRAHIADLVRMKGGDINAVLVSLEPPVDVARRYKQLYGYSSLFKALFVILAGVLAVPTLPVLQIKGEEVMIPVLISLIFLSVLAILLVFVALQAGRTVGLVAGLVACFTRLGLFGILVGAGGENVIVQAGGASLLVAVSLLLVLLGYIPGEAKARWTKPSGEI